MNCLQLSIRALTGIPLDAMPEYSPLHPQELYHILRAHGWVLSEHARRVEFTDGAREPVELPAHAPYVFGDKALVFLPGHCIAWNGLQVWDCQGEHKEPVEDWELFFTLHKLA